MKPSVPLALTAVLNKLEDMMKAETDSLKAFDLSRIRTILSVVHRDWDGSADDLVAEINALLILLRRGAEISPPSLRKTLEDMAERGGRVKDLRISALEATVDDLLIALIELQAWLEETSSTSAQMLLTDVWLYLDRSARNRAVIEFMW